ncbi:MAG: 4-phosphopantetheinyl transferase superfamily protein [Chitinophagaceae bacterium]|nr:4-phosphopantetheinyl transferase superfamily protein [Chitinophagaceae bacterium]
MPLFYQQNINDSTSLAIWHITEDESFFSEKAIVQRNITHPHKRLQHLAGRYLLRFLFPDFPNDELRVADTKKPFLPGEQYHFSISHCGEYAAVIVSRDKRVGIDIEQYSSRVENIKHKFLHVDEMAMIETTTDQPVNLLTTFWCAKEAMFKWWAFGDIDFSEVLRIENLPQQKEGTLQGYFTKDDVEIPLCLHYNLFDEIALVWLATEPDVFKVVD